MEYKICEKCGAKLHFRTQKCPICNTVLTEASKIENDDIIIENTNPSYDITITDYTMPNTEKQPKEEISAEFAAQKAKDYISHSAEGQHSLEFTEPLSNMIKVLLSAIACIFCEFPVRISPIVSEIIA